MDLFTHICGCVIMGSAAIFVPIAIFAWCVDLWRNYKREW